MTSPSTIPITTVNRDAQRPLTLLSIKIMALVLLIPVLGTSQSGNVGIGTTAPDNLLHIVGPQDGDSMGIKLTSLGPNNNSLIYHDGNSLILRRKNVLDQLVLTSGGRVGIGTAAPTMKFTVNGNASIITENQSNTTRELLIRGARDDANGAYARVAFANYDLTSDSTYIGAIVTSRNFQADAKGDLQMWTRGVTGIAPRMTILPNGNTGIGTTNPTRVLHVVGASRIEGNQTLASPGPGSNIRTLVIQGRKDDATPFSQLLMTNYDETSDKTYSGVIMEAINASGLARGSFALYTNPGTTPKLRLLVKHDGKVGINNNFPSQILDVNGNIAVTTPATEGVTRSVNIAGAVDGIGNYAQVNFINYDLSKNQSYTGGRIAVNNKTGLGGGEMRFYTAAQNGNLFLRMTLRNNGRVGIGTENPLALLDVNGSARISTTGSNAQRGLTIKGAKDGNSIYGFIDFQNYDLTEDAEYSGALVASLNSGGAGVGDLRFQTNPGTGLVQRVIISDSGNLGIGTVTPSERLHVVGNIVYTGTLSNISDIRFKKNISKLKDALATVNAINGYNYHFKTEEYPKMNFPESLQVGVIAQELEAVLPELVMTNGKGIKTVNYSQLTAVLLEAIKEQQVMIEAQAITIENQASRMDMFEAQIREILGELDFQKTTGNN